jgi:hypothetical protein
MGISPSSKGWVKKYFSLIENYETVLQKFPGSVLNSEELIYAFIQPTGLMYGHPTSFVFLDNNLIHKLSLDESFKILLLEGLFLVDYIHKGKIEHNNLIDSLNRFVSFYESTQLEKAKKGWLNFSKLDLFGKVESIISQRVKIKGNIANKIVTTYLNNGLLFHDLVLYQYYLSANSAVNLVEKRSEIMLVLVKIVALSAKSDGHISDEEKGIFKIFVASANLNSNQKLEAERFFDTGKSLNDIDFIFENTWLLRRFVLEIAILTLWSDKGISDLEQQFLIDLTEELSLKIADRDNAYIAIQSFVLSHHNDSLFLKGKNDVELMLSGAGKRWSKILGRNKDKLAIELQNSKELVSLISKSRKRDLTKG